MRKILSFVIVAAVVAYFVACSVDEDYNPNYQKPILKNSYVVSIPQAIDRLNAMFPNSVTVTRSRVSEVITLSRKDFGSVTRSSTTADAPLIYIIPTDDNGCAVMGADSRMTPLYALLENTTLTAEDFLNIDTRTDNEADDAEIKEFVTSLLYDAAIEDIEHPIVPWDSTMYPSPGISLIRSIDSLTESHQAYLATKWDQSKPPYNSNLPDYLDSIAGCGTIAIAQIIYHNRIPQTIGMTTFDWDKISTFEYGNTSYPKYPKEVANFVRLVAEELNVKPSTSGTGSTNQDALNFFNNYYQDRGYYIQPCYYNDATVKYMLLHNNPVYISGKNSVTQMNHAWVLDGYKKYDVYEYNTITEEVSKTDSCKYYFHSNFGWGGRCDGYFLSKLFNATTPLASENVIDSIGDVRITKQTCNYDTDFFVIFYAIP